MPDSFTWNTKFVMLPKNCGNLLYNAVRETLETMAFADVVPCSIKVAGEEFARDDDFAVAGDVPSGETTSGWGDEASDLPDPADAWGTAVPAATVPAASWGDSPEPTGTAPPVEDDWGARTSGTSVLAPSNPWGDGGLLEAAAVGHNRPKEADFDEMAATHTDWCWACMKVNSPDVHSIWFIIPKTLANALMENMYAGEETQQDDRVVRDLIAELTNVLGGRLMLLLEEMGGKFTLTVPDIGLGMPDISEAYTSQGVVCKVMVDSTHPVIVALCFNQGGVFAAN